MELFKIEKVKVTCSICETSVIVPINAKNLHCAEAKKYQLPCPNCDNDLTEIMTAARKCAIQYNNICDELENLETQGCNFENN